MKKQCLSRQDLCEFIQKYYKLNGRTPKNKEWIEKDGFPCSREFLRKNILSKEYDYNNLIEEAGFKRRTPFNAKGDKVSEDDLIKFIQKYHEETGVVPCLWQFKEKDGFPCNKEYLAKNYKYNDLVATAGFRIYEYGQRHYDEKKIIEDLRKAVIESRSFNIDVLHENHDCIMHRDTYTRLFGEFENALLAAGIENRHKILISRFKEYKLEDPVEFLKNKFGKDGAFTHEQNELIISIQKVSKYGDLRRDVMKKKISLHKCKKLFETYGIALIAAGLNPAKTMRSRIMAKDGHLCDSYEESLVDNILYELNIKHDVHKTYPGTKLICDFKVGDNIYIEYIGFAGVDDNYIRGRYLQKLEAKKLIVDRIGAKLIIIDKVDEKTMELIRKNRSLCRERFSNPNRKLTNLSLRLAKEINADDIVERINGII